jgi:hypothetical protein
VTRGIPDPELIEHTRRRWRRAAGVADAVRLAMRGLLRPLAGLGRFACGPPRGRRLVIVQVDGVSRRRLERAMADGFMPALAARLASGRHVLSSCRSGAPASTPAFQAGLFYGVSPSVPGFVWFDRDTRREVRMDRPDDAAAMERRLARTGRGLLRGGTSYFSIFSGGAALPHFCLSGLAGDIELDWYAEHLGPWDLCASTLAHSVTAARSGLRVAQEVAAGLVDGLRWSIALGRVKHEPRFLAHRVLIGALLRELAVQGILVDLSRGIPVVFVDFLSFDETAHRRGPDADAALRCLASIDAALAVIFSAADAVPELGYEVHVLSDHGHVPTLPFESLAGATLPEYVALADRGEPLPRGPRAPPSRGLLGGRTLRGRRVDGVAVAEAGDLAHVYFLDDRGPLPLDGLRARHWRVLAALSASRAVGLLAVRGGARGLALVRGEVLDLADPSDVARLPHPDAPLLATYLADLLALRECGDIVVQGWRGEGREVVAYAWEFGSHGGVAPEELEAFVAHPAQCAFRFADAIRPSELHAFFERVRAGAGRRPRGAAASGAPRAARGEAALRPEGPAEGGGRGIPAP